MRKCLLTYYVVGKGKLPRLNQRREEYIADLLKSKDKRLRKFGQKMTEAKYRQEFLFRLQWIPDLKWTKFAFFDVSFSLRHYL
jgi:hypothetical protein